MSAGGIRPWVVQRVSAVYMGVYIGIIAVLFLSKPIVDFIDWRERLSYPTMNIATLLFVFALLIHAWVGVRDVVMDYVHSAALRFSVLSLAAVYFAAMAVWTVR
ncbi:MAG: succinate dehydrogenase, hydrophobic membrane anchor protein, partial [Gammaproteobacteria bacterium]|nr:succinate dehydrogenase, hydrophobic membrane anchor protein [Gammaproteobacteria bacterium]